MFVRGDTRWTGIRRVVLCVGSRRLVERVELCKEKTEKLGNESQEGSAAGQCADLAQYRTRGLAVRHQRAGQVS